MPLKALVEVQKDGEFKALDQFFNPIKIKSDKPLRASFLEIKEYEIKERKIMPFSKNLENLTAPLQTH